MNFRSKRKSLLPQKPLSFSVWIFLLNSEKKTSPFSTARSFLIWQPHIVWNILFPFFNAHGYMESAYMVTHLEILSPRVQFGKCPNPPQYSPQIIYAHMLLDVMFDRHQKLTTIVKSLLSTWWNRPSGMNSASLACRITFWECFIECSALGCVFLVHLCVLRNLGNVFEEACRWSPPVDACCWLPFEFTDHACCRPPSWMFG